MRHNGAGDCFFFWRYSNIAFFSAFLRCFPHFLGQFPPDLWCKPDFNMASENEIIGFIFSHIRFPPEKTNQT